MQIIRFFRAEYRTASPECPAQVIRHHASKEIGKYRIIVKLLT
jgi:hypothetical protein